MNKEQFYINFETALKDFKEDFEKETKNFSDDKVNKILESMFVFFNVKEQCIEFEFCSGSYGLDIFYPSPQPYNSICVNEQFLFSDDYSNYINKAIQDGIRYFEDEIDADNVSEVFEKDAQETLNILKQL